MGPPDRGAGQSVGGGRCPAELKTKGVVTTYKKGKEAGQVGSERAWAPPESEAPGCSYLALLGPLLTKAATFSGCPVGERGSGQTH